MLRSLVGSEMCIRDSTQPGCIILAHLHFGRLILGLQLNSTDFCSVSAPLSEVPTRYPDSKISAPGPDKLLAQGLASTDSAFEEPGCNPDEDAVCAAEAVAPWRHLPYAEQLARKRHACFGATLKFVRRLKKQWRTATGQGRVRASHKGALSVQLRDGDWECVRCSSICFEKKLNCFKCGADKLGVISALDDRDDQLEIPDWLQPRTHSHMFEFGQHTIGCPPDSQVGYRNKIVLTVGCSSKSGGNGRVAGFRVSSGVVEAPSADCSAVMHPDMLALTARMNVELLQESGAESWRSISMRGSVRTGQLSVTILTSHSSSSQIPQDHVKALQDWFRETVMTGSCASMTLQAAALVPSQDGAAIMLLGTEEDLCVYELLQSACGQPGHQSLLRFRISPKAFFQTNTAAAEQLFKLVANLALLSPSPNLDADSGLVSCADSARSWVLMDPVSYTHLRAHETPEHLVCRLLLEKKKKETTKGRKERK
eukprot:TRINITY_DN23719_c0_g3_i1.p1 TRINITY_DN23719_c0_g3~~TRINITY_DN23719_c0_g3_i1.p1  ORF type:complete len:515 (+),score=78.67 TRINITY_DN23719_c0_g3_i1:98-1546(+)